MAQIIDFEKARRRLRPSPQHQTYLVLELPQEFVDEMNDLKSPVVMARVDLLVF